MFKETSKELLDFLSKVLFSLTIILIYFKSFKIYY